MAVVVKKGDRGPAVKRIQRSVGVGSDGVFGAQTARAVKRFQRSKGLEADGVVGPMTREAMGLRAFARESVVRKGSKQQRTQSPLRSTGAMAVLERIAECESGGKLTALSATGLYRGKYQFSRSTWKANGGEGDPIDASEAEQDRIALALYRAEGVDPWPVCGRDAK